MLGLGSLFTIGLNLGETLAIFQTIEHPSVSPLSVFSKKGSFLASILIAVRPLLPRKGK